MIDGPAGNSIPFRSANPHHSEPSKGVRIAGSTAQPVPTGIPKVIWTSHESCDDKKGHTHQQVTVRVLGNSGVPTRSSARSAANAKRSSRSDRSVVRLRDALSLGLLRKMIKPAARRRSQRVRAPLRSARDSIEHDFAGAAGLATLARYSDDLHRLVEAQSQARHSGQVVVGRRERAGARSVEHPVGARRPPFTYSVRG